MANFRNIKTGFWTDRKVLNDMSPEDKYFFLYLLTNPEATQLGIYELNPKYAAFCLGYSIDAVKVLIDRFQNKYDLIRYSNETGEVAIKNYLSHSIIKGGKPVMDCLKKEESQVKDKSLVIYIMDYLNTKNNLNDTVIQFLDYLKDKYKDDKDIEEDKDKDKDKERNVDVTFWERIDENFECLWGLFPNKKGKSDVSKKAKKEIYKIGYDHMARAIERYANEVKGVDSKFIKHGSTFFNGSYKDYLDDVYVPPRDTSNDAILAFLNAEDD